MTKNIFSGVLLLALVISTFPVSAQAEEPTSRDRLNALIQEATRLTHASNPSLVKPLSEQQMQEVISESVDWFQNAQEENGHLRYEYLPYEDRYHKDDNTVRQAGALYALGDIETRDEDNVYDLDQTIENSISFFEGLSRSAEFNDREFECIRELNSRNRCKLGTASLALVGMLGYVEANPEKEDEYKELMVEYKEFIVAMKKDGEGFRNIYSFALDEQTDAESPFFNGEAMLALVRYNQMYPSDEVEEIIDEMFMYIDSEKNPFEPSLYLWATAAIKDMHAENPNPLYVDYVKRYTNWRIGANPKSRHKNTHNYCAYLEGVVSAYSVLETSLTDAELKKFKDEIDFWLAKSASLQVSEKDRFRYATGGLMEIENMEQARGGFLTGESKEELTQRIDFTQHCVSSYVQTLIDIQGKSFAR